MLKKYLSGFFVILLLAFLVSAQVFASTGSYITVSSSSAYAGDTVSISVQAENLKNVASLELILGYDADALSVSNVSHGPMVISNLNDVNSAVSGEIRFSSISVNGMNGSGTLLTVTFQVAENCPAGNYPITLGIGDVLDTAFSSVTVAGNSGLITVEEKPVVTEPFTLYSYTNADSFKKGDTLELTIASAATLPFVAADFTIEYNDSLLKIEDLKLQDAMNTDGCIYDLNTSVSGTAKLSFVSTQVVQTFYLFTVNFTVTGDIDGTTALTTTATAAYKEDMTPYAASSPSTRSVTLSKIPEVVDYSDIWITAEPLIVGKESSAQLIVEGSSGLAAADFLITYDPAILQIKSVAATEVANNENVLIIINDTFSDGKIRFSYVNTSADYAEDLPLVEIQFVPLTSPEVHYQFIPSATGVVDVEHNALTFDYISATGCIYVPTVKQPTCTAEGYTTYACAAAQCGNSYTQDVTSMLPHTYEDSVLICDNCGHERKVNAISMNANPAKTEYIEKAETLDLTGAMLKVDCDDGQSIKIPITADMVKGFNNLTVGEQILMVSYGGKTTAFSIEIKPLLITSIEVITPSKTEYLEGSPLELTGGMVKIHFNASNGYYETVQLTEQLISGYNANKPGMQELTVTYEGFTTKLQVNVIAKTAVSLEIIQNPTKLRYFAKKDSLDVTGGKVKISYDNNTTQTLDMTAQMVFGFDNAIPGDQTLNVAWEGVSDSFSITIYTATVSFVDWNGTTIQSNQYMYGDEVVAPYSPTKAADNTYTYAFAGWDKPVVDCVGDATYTATYESTYIEYLVKFKDWNGDVLSSKTYHWGDSIEVPADPSKTADDTYSYTFSGWDNEVITCAGNTTYTATYEPAYIDYTIVFKNWDGYVLSSKTYHWGDKVFAPTNPTKAADNTYTYAFAGWDKAVVNCAGDATYKATYTPDYINYTVTFVDWDDEVISSETYHYGDEVKVPADPAREADNTYTYAFSCWDNEVIDCAGSTTYTATYESTYIEYTIVFENWDGTVLSSKTYHWGDSVVEPAVPTKLADNTYTYAFNGWDKAVVNCAGDATYKATYEPVYIDYTVKFVDWNNEVISSETYHYGDEVKAPANPSKAADNTYTYTFSGWDKTVVNCAGNATYTATYAPIYIDYTVTFENWNGTILSTKTYHWGDVVELPENPIREKDDYYTYTFSGWNPEVVSCSGHASYQARFDAKHYHTYNQTMKKPTCTEQGYTTNICACGDTFKDAYITETGHSYDDTCDTTCNICKAERSITHKYKTTTTKATLSKNGSIVKKCTVCGNVASNKVISYAKTIQLSAASYTYDGKVKTPTVTVKDAAGKVLTADTDYTVTYASGRKNLGSYTVTVAMKGNYSGTKALSFTINLATPTAKAANASTGVKVTWNKISGAKTYTVYRSVYSDGAWSSWKEIESGCTGTAYTDTSVKSNTNVRYTVRAVNGNYQSSYMASNSIKFLATPTVKAANASTGVKVTWNKISGAKTYTVYRSVYSDGAWSSWKSIKTECTGTSFTDTAVKSGQRVRYTVRAVNGKYQSAYVSSSSITFLARPNVTAKNTASTGKVKLSWDKISGAERYYVYRSTSKDGTYTRIASTTKTAYTDSDASVGKTYYYKVKAIRSTTSSSSTYSSPDKGVRDLKQPDVTVQLSKGDPKLSWEKVSGATKYYIYRATSKDGTYERIKSTTTTAYTDTSAKAGKTYYYKVKAIHSVSAANSAYSAVDKIQAK